MINMCSRLSVLGGLPTSSPPDSPSRSYEEDGKPRLSGALMRRDGVLEAVGLRDIDTCEDAGLDQAAWSTLRER